MHRDTMVQVPPYSLDRPLDVPPSELTLGRSRLDSRTVYEEQIDVPLPVGVGRASNAPETPRNDMVNLRVFIPIRGASPLTLP